MPNSQTLNKADVPQAFNRVAKRYDLMTALSPGYGKSLRRSATRLALTPEKACVLDVCCGTGASTQAILDVFPHARPTGLDGSESMLAVARKRFALKPVAWRLGLSESLSATFAAQRFDAVFTAFGLRNAESPKRMLEEARAVLAPGGRIVVHDYILDGKALSRLRWEALCRGIIEPMGLVMTRERQLFRYLRQSVIDFGTVAEVTALMRDVGASNVTFESQPGWLNGLLGTWSLTFP